MNSKNDLIGFIDWISNRLRYKYREQEDSIIFDNLKEIKCLLKPKEKNINITQDKLDSILVKYYADFNMDSFDNINIGYTDDQRQKLREVTISIAKDILEYCD